MSNENNVLLIPGRRRLVSFFPGTGYQQMKRGCKMKYLVLLGDGMADYAVPELGGKTPLQVGKKPNMDRLAKEGVLGQVRTVPPGLPPGSDVANLAVLG